MSTNGVETAIEVSREGRGRFRMPRSAEAELDLIRDLSTKPIVMSQPVATESITEDILAAVRRIVDERLDAIDRFLATRTTWNATSQGLKYTRIANLLTLAVKQASRLPTQKEVQKATRGATARDAERLREYANIREGVVMATTAAYALIRDLSSDFNKQTAAMESEIRFLISPSELAYGNGPSDEELAESTIAIASRRASGLPIKPEPITAIVPDIVIQRPPDTNHAKLFDHVRRVPIEKRLTPEQRELALEDVKSGMRALEVARKYSVKIRTAKAWVERYGPRAVARRKALELQQRDSLGKR